MKYAELQYLAVPLPEDILKEKWSGNFDRARKLINYRLGTELPRSLNCRLELELEHLDNLQRCYTITEAEALAQVRTHIPDFTEEEFAQLQLEGKIDWMYIEGERLYLNSFCATLFKVYPELWSRSVIGDKSDYRTLDALVEDLSPGQELAAHIHIRHTLSIAPEAVEEGQRIRVHLPMPVERDQVRNLRVVSVQPQPAKWPEKDEAQPTLYFEAKAQAGQTFAVEYALDHVTTYVDLAQTDLQAVAEAEIPEAEKKYLAEELPHIRFTPYLKALAEELRGEETNPVRIARRFYDYITTKTDYRFVRDYNCIDSIAEYCAVNGKGDCGVEALLFITLCRICGIPARWQSGIDAKPGDVGEHDWAMFYVPSIGWVYADLSYGGSAYIRGAYKRWNYFFGNADPYRIPINNQVQQEFLPPKDYPRIDPYDNQCGEIEYDDRGVYGDDLQYHYEEIDIHRIK